jgi:hypothetical protein
LILQQEHPVRIDTINITVQSPVAKAFLEALLHDMAAPPAAPAAPAAASTTQQLTPPAIGAMWPEQGGIYAGLARGENGAPDAHLVLATVPAAEGVTWQAAIDWAAGLDHEGHSDWALPTRWESALLYANVRDQIDTDGWYWTRTPHEKDGSCAWNHYFHHGTQDYTRKSYEGRARAVRRLTA